MAITIYTDDDANFDLIKGDPIAIIGYGSQGRAHAMNLKDSGADVIVGVRKGGKGWNQAQEDGLEVAEVADAAKRARIVMMLTPDMSHEDLYTTQIEDNLEEGDALVFAHGFSILYGRVKPPKGVDVFLVAPKGPGALVRSQYESGRGVPCLFAVEVDATGKAKDRALAYAKGIGGGRGGVMETTFREETETDLFGEQAVLCGGATELVLAGFETLVEAGYQPEIAYYECLHELKLIVDLLNEGGLAKMHEFISETAKYGDLVSGPRVINADTKARMKEVLTDIQKGKFAHDWIVENQAGKVQYDRMLQADLDHQIEEVGRGLRSRMSWMKEKGNAPA